jgi:conjugal transfer pilus assembly protein TraL
MEKSYKTFRLSEEPRVFGVPIVTAVPVVLLTLAGLISGNAPTFFMIGGSISLLIHVTMGKSPFKKLLGYVYWYLPHFITKLFMKNLPDSAFRKYKR